MQVQKLTYFCHGWMLGLGYGPLFQDAVESWQYGPVIRSVYHHLKGYGRHPVSKPLLESPDDFNQVEERVIQAVWQGYGGYGGVRLSQMTHADGSPWEQTYQQDKRSQIIHNHVIRDYYKNMVKGRGK